MKFKRTERGFGRIDFKDQYGYECSLQESSLATGACIWFGPDEPHPKVHRPYDGWYDVPLPEGTVCHTRMHLTQKMVKKLLPYLIKFVETGELK